MPGILKHCTTPASTLRSANASVTPGALARISRAASKKVTIPSRLCRAMRESRNTDRL